MSVSRWMMFEFRYVLQGHFRTKFRRLYYLPFFSVPFFSNLPLHPHDLLRVPRSKMGQFSEREEAEEDNWRFYEDSLLPVEERQWYPYYKGPPYVPASRRPH